MLYNIILGHIVFGDTMSGVRTFLTSKCSKPRIEDRPFTSFGGVSIESAVGGGQNSILL